MRSGACVHDRMPALLAEQDFEPCAERHRWRRTVDRPPEDMVQTLAGVEARQ